MYYRLLFSAALAHIYMCSQSFVTTSVYSNTAQVLTQLIRWQWWTWPRGRLLLPRPLPTVQPKRRNKI